MRSIARGVATVVLAAVVGGCGGSGGDELVDQTRATVGGPSSASSSTALPSTTQLVATTATTEPTTNITATSTTATSTTATSGPTTTITATVPPSVASAAVTPTVPAIPAQAVAIDLALPSPVLELAVITSFPLVSVPTGAPYWVAPASDGRIAVLETANNVVRFLDATTGLETARSATDIPPSSVGGFLVGPDDVLYINQFGDGVGPSLVAYGRRDARYVDLGPRGPGVGDQTLVLGATGIAVMGGMTEPLLAYVGADGQPSGATVAVNDLRDFQIQDQLVGLARGELAWNVQYASNECLATGGGAALCVSVEFGPLDTLMLTDQVAQSDATRPTKLTMLSEGSAVSWDTDWAYAGSVDDMLLLVRNHDDSFEIGVFAVP